MNKLHFRAANRSLLHVGQAENVVCRFFKHKPCQLATFWSSRGA